MLARFGKKRFADVLAPTILSARAGFPVTEIFGEGWAYATSYLQSNPEAARVFLINGRPPKIGELFRNPSLAGTLAELATHGAVRRTAEHAVDAFAALLQVG